MTPQTTATADWPMDIHRVLEAASIRQVSYVPDAGHARLIRACAATPSMRTVPLTTEEEGVALAAGAWLGGSRSVLLMQSSGVGNCVNMLSLAKSCRFPLLMLITMRGEWAEFNPWQVPMGSIVEPVLRLCDAQIFRVTHAEEAGEVVEAAADLAFNGDLVTAVLLSQRLIGRKKWIQ